MSKLLINEQRLQVIPSLAVAIGLNEAIFVQQLHYFLNISKHKYEERIWIYNTIDEWCEIFPFWSKKTIQRTIKRLEEMGLILSTNKLNKMKMDKTKWYSIAYEKIEELTSQNDQMRCDQNGSSMRSKWDDRYSQNDQMSCGQNDHTNNHKNKEIYTQENTPLPPKGESANADGEGNAKKDLSAKNKKNRSAEKIDYQGVIEAFNEANTENGSRLPFVRELSDKRKTSIKKFLLSLKEPTAECAGNYFNALFSMLRPFHFGEEKNSTWKANFDWAIRAETVIKVREENL
ncbi:hypothetical protein M8850_03260 [Pasteurella multocida]|uniref:hypothetical protein n=1 Tax=Pasteurella multocida TaxID=747 RepID=UPI0020237E1D|nr:hypothetical protein [Pasteurella multocida]URH94759.1 hypothetical protein M8850_03260 [Pasteurella multocida]